MSEQTNNKELSKLTDRETEVLKCVSGSLTNKEIASKLYVCVKTIESHKHNIIKKLKLKNTNELLIFSILKFLNALMFVSIFLPDDLF